MPCLPEICPTGYKVVGTNFYGGWGGGLTPLDTMFIVMTYSFVVCQVFSKKIGQFLHASQHYYFAPKMLILQLPCSLWSFGQNILPINRPQSKSTI